MQTFRRELTVRFNWNVSEWVTQQLLSSMEMWQWPQLGQWEGRAQQCSKTTKGHVWEGSQKLLEGRAQV